MNINLQGNSILFISCARISASLVVKVLPARRSIMFFPSNCAKGSTRILPQPSMLTPAMFRRTGRCWKIILYLTQAVQTCLMIRSMIFSANSSSASASAYSISCPSVPSGSTSPTILIPRRSGTRIPGSIISVWEWRSEKVWRTASRGSYLSSCAC